MNTQYNVFEILPEGYAILRAFAKGTKHSLWMLKVVGKQTCNECFATTLNSRRIIGRANEKLSTSQINAHGHQGAAS